MSHGAAHDGQLYRPEDVPTALRTRKVGSAERSELMPRTWPVLISVPWHDWGLSGVQRNRCAAWPGTKPVRGPQREWFRRRLNRFEASNEPGRANGVKRPAAFSRGMRCCRPGQGRPECAGARPGPPVMAARPGLEGAENGSVRRGQGRGPRTAEVSWLSLPLAA